VGGGGRPQSRGRDPLQVRVRRIEVEENRQKKKNRRAINNVKKRGSRTVACEKEKNSKMLENQGRIQREGLTGSGVATETNEVALDEKLRGRATRNRGVPGRLNKLGRDGNRLTKGPERIPVI